MERKGFGPRLLAVLIDIVIMLAILCPVSLIAGTGMSFSYGSPAGPPTGAARFGAILGALLGLAYASTEIFLAGTPGKLILKLAIGSETGAVPAPQDQLIRRWVVKWSPSLLNLLYGLTTWSVFSWLGGLAALVILVGFFFCLGTNRQALHDVLAKTAVFARLSAMQGFSPIMGGGAVPGAFPPQGPGAYPPPGLGTVAGPGPVPPAGTNVPPPPPPPPAVG